MCGGEGGGLGGGGLQCKYYGWDCVICWYNDSVGGAHGTHDHKTEKTINVVFAQVKHKLSCTSTEDGYRVEILDLESREIAKSVL